MLSKIRTAGHRPREMRDADRMQRAARVARRGARPALAAALAQIEAAFDESARINAFKIKVDDWLQRGPHHPAARARFGARAAMLRGRSLDAAIVTVERWWRDERRAFAIASAFGRGSRLSLNVLSELRLILRWLRFKRMEATYGATLDALCDVYTATAAE